MDVVEQYDDEWLEDALRAHRRRVEQHGWSVVGSPAEGGDSAHAYTVGLSRFRNHPEILVSVSKLGGAHLVLDELGEHVRRGHDFQPYEEISFSDGGVARFVDGISSEWVPLARLLCAAPMRPVDVLQLVVADRQGRWPGDRDYRPTGSIQQVFDRPPGFAVPQIG